MLIDQSSPGRHPPRPQASGTNLQERHLISVLAGQATKAFPGDPAMKEGRAISSYLDDANLTDNLEHGVHQSYAPDRGAMRPRITVGRGRTRAVKHATLLTALTVMAAVGGTTQALAPRAHAMPAPDTEFVYDVMVRRQYNFASPDEAISYGYKICDKVSNGESYAQVMGEVKSDVVPNDEFAANYLVSYAVNLLCPAQIWQLRHSAAGYRPPPE